MAKEIEKLDLSQSSVEATLPDGILTVSLFRHQKIALAWILKKETNSVFCSGGILADDQGLGKTITMIALIEMQKLLQSKGKPEDSSHRKFSLDYGGDNDTTVLDQASASRCEFPARMPRGGTLVVAPATVLRQWARELEEKVAEEAKLNVLVYHGTNRTEDPVELAAYDVILTTYALVTKEVPGQHFGYVDDDDHKMGQSHGLPEFVANKKQKKTIGALARVRWNRVVLDEAHTIKNHSTQVARSCCSLKAKAKWCLSGTPVQNAIDELFSYFRFLRYDPYSTYRSFYIKIKTPISRNSINGYKKLHDVLRPVMLRRSKGTLIDGEPIITLPSKTINLSKVEFSVEERLFYHKLEVDSRSQFRAYAAAGTLPQNYANVLVLLLRLRQACDHPLLVKGFTSDSVGRYSSQIAKNLSRDMLINPMKHLQTSSAICGACKDSPEDAIVTMCGHVFCIQCVSKFLRGDENKCPVPECKQLPGRNVVFSKSMLKSCVSGDLDDNPSSLSEPEKSTVLRRDYIPSKIKAAIEILKSHCKSNSPCQQLHGAVHCNGNSSSQGEELSNSSSTGLDATVEAPRKAIVFSQWIGMLDLVEMAMNQSGLRYRRLDGSMTLSARDNSVTEFNTIPEVTVMLMSLKAGNLGLNMVAASHVILLDPWWNPAIEDQAIDRAHRIAQTCPVTVSRLTIKDSVEDRILALQEKKRKMVASAFGEDPSGVTLSKLTVEDLRYLFMGNQ